jgi:hypothetical protein
MIVLVDMVLCNRGVVIVAHPCGWGGTPDFAYRRHGDRVERRYS